MPYNKDGKYYLNDVEYNSLYIMKPIYDRCKAVCEHSLRTQQAFEGMIRLFEDSGYTMQRNILKLFEGTSDA